MQPHRDLVVVGASAGGIQALLTLLGDGLNRRSMYPATYATFIVLSMRPREGG